MGQVDSAPGNIQQLTRDQYQALHDQISSAREACTDPVKRTLLRQRAEQVQAVLTALDQADMQSRTADFENLKKQIASVNSDLAVLKGEIDKIVQDVAVATQVAGAIDSAVSAAAKLFG
jgi:archaellum component FlaC